jgi:NitT/TauT family transport system ATP-binding protein
MAGPLCELKDVSQNFPQPSGAPLVVLKDINLQVQPKEVVALLGPSGCGKSTILRILAGLIRPTHGEALYHGEPLQGLNPGVAIVFQSFALYPWMTVVQNVEAVLRAAGLPDAEVRERALGAIRTVGLAGFEDAYPRELSGGMKQRVGMARAFSLNPEMLFMDEPFSQVDALTAESLRAEVLDIWAAKDKHPSSILMVSHDIKEVAYMADRIVVLGAHPGVVRTIVHNTLPRPRDYRSPELLHLVDRLHDIITGAELPDVAPTPTVGETLLIEPLPDAGGGEVVGLLEYLDARGGREDVFKIATDTDREFGAVINVVKAAELLDLVDTPKRQVVLAQDGMHLVRAQPADRKVIWREQLLKLGLFRRMKSELARQPDQRLPKEVVVETIAMAMPAENYEAMFERFVRWARFGDLFDYDEQTEVLSLPPVEAPK